MTKTELREEIRECDRQIERLNKKATRQAFFYSACGVAMLMIWTADQLSGSTVAAWFVIGTPVCTFVFRFVIFNLFPSIDDSTLYLRDVEYRKRELFFILKDIE